MIPRSASSRPSRSLIRLTFAAIALLAIGLISARHAPNAQESLSAGAQPLGAHHGHAHHADEEEMSEEEMQEFVDAWFAANPRVGAYAVGTPVVTFRAFSSTFDYDGDLAGTPIDSVVIGVGDIVAWQRLIGAHTITNGVDSQDSEAATLFDQPLDAANPTFQYQYNTPGRFPFFCRTHEDLNMQGVVTVVGATSTERTTWGGIKARSR
jgi:plastocyanin